MKRFTAILLLLPLSGCASMRRHPALYGIAIGAAAGATIALATRHTCPNTYEGHAYEGTPPCPK